MSTASKKLKFLVSRGATEKEAFILVTNDQARELARLRVDNKLLLDGQGRQEIEMNEVRAENKRLRAVIAEALPAIDDFFKEAVT